MLPLMKYEVHETEWKKVFQSLKKQGILTKPIQSAIQKAFKVELDLRIKEYQRGRSSSISVSQYKELRSSMFYLLDHALPMEGQKEYFLQTPIHEQIQFGEIKVEEQIDAITSLWLTCKQRLIYFPNERYHSILVEQIPKFLAGYDIKYHAHRCEQDLDYPLIDGLALDHSMYHKKGSDLVYEYLQRYDIEQRYAMHFQEELSQIIERYEQLHGVSIYYLGLNLSSLLMPLHLCERLLPNALTHCFSKEDCAYMYTHMQRLDYTCLKKCLDEPIYEYYKIALRDTQERLLHANRDVISNLLLDTNHCLKQVFRIPPTNMMDTFELVYEIVTSKPTINEKIEVLKSYSIGAQDMIDLFENGIFYREEFFYYYTSCSILELAVFLFISKQEEFAFHQSMDREMMKRWTSDNEWESALYSYILQCSNTRWKALQSLYDTITFEILI